MAVGEIFYEKWKSFNYAWRRNLASFIAPDGTYVGDAAWFNLGGNDPIWLDTNDLWSVYMEVPHANVVINKKAELFSLGRWRMRDIKSKKEIEQDPILDMIDCPNPLQSQGEWMQMYEVFKEIWGGVPIFKNYGVISLYELSKVPGQLWCLPNNLMTIHRTGKLFRQTKIEEIIKYYELTMDNSIEKFDPKEILFKSANVGPTYLVSESKLVGLKLPLSNIYAAMSTANVLTKEHGAYGILSTAGSKDASGILPLRDKEKKRVEQQYDRNYGLQYGKRKTIITGASVTYTPISFPITDMNLQPEIEQDFGLVCDAFGMARDLFSSTKGATFENQRQALKHTIQNAIQADANDLARSFNKDWELKSKGRELFVTYDHLPVMQEDRKQLADTLKTMVDALTTAKQEGGITDQEYRDEIQKLLVVTR